MREMWWDITGDSYIVDARVVFDRPGAADYLVKYLFKSGGDREKLEDLGYTRRYSTARNWPRETKLVLRGTFDEWHRVEWQNNRASAAAEFLRQPKGLGPLQLYGPRSAIARVHKGIVKNNLKELEELFDNGNG